jgi:hypothetical protein
MHIVSKMFQRAASSLFPAVTRHLVTMNAPQSFSCWRTIVIPINRDDHVMIVIDQLLCLLTAAEGSRLVWIDLIERFGHEEMLPSTFQNLLHRLGW